MNGARVRAWIALWSAGGVLLLLGQAIWRLTPLALEPLRDGSMSAAHIGLGVAWMAVNAWAEGYKAFQQRFSPRVVRRALELAEAPRPLFVLFGPLWAMSLVGDSRRRMIVSWATTLGIVALVLTVRLVPQPWRGIIDAGVVVALCWGAVAIVVYLARGLAGVPVREVERRAA